MTRKCFVSIMLLFCFCRGYFKIERKKIVLHPAVESRAHGKTKQKSIKTSQEQKKLEEVLIEKSSFSVILKGQCHEIFDLYCFAHTSRG